ncbi:isocitrate lyase/PEP mutase family protein [Paenibacillus sp. CAU 1782]
MGRRKLANDSSNSVDLPITIDIEGGYGASPEMIKSNVLKIIQRGAVGVNFEDQKIHKPGLYAIDEQALRIAAVREAAEHASIPLFINARTDVFFETAAHDHEETHLEAALQRAHAYAEAGAHGIFVPGLCNEMLIQKLCQQSSLPVNVMISPDSPSPKKLASLGIACISYGPRPYLKVMDTLKQATASALALLG